MATGLFTPILNDRTRAPHFFNGRLLTGEAMTDEQRAQHAVHELLAQGLGDGVAHGLQVEPSKEFNSIDRPVVTVKAGVAISRRGDVMLLTADTDVELVRPATASAAPQRIFDACTPPQPGVYVSDQGVYLLTIAPVTVGNGLAPVSGLGGGGQSCNVKYRIDAVQFRLIQLPVDGAVLADVGRLQNRVAYACFGVGQIGAFARDAFGAATASSTLLDQVRATSLADCEVPLAVMHWTATGGIRFLDIWAARRRLTSTRHASSFVALADVRLSIAEAMILQFQQQLAAKVQETIGTLAGIQAKSFLRWMPPAGLVPIAAGNGSTGFDVHTFFTGKTWNLHQGWTSPIYIEGGAVEPLLRQSPQYPPIDLDDREMVWLYWVHENIRALHTGSAVKPYVVFTNANLPFAGEPRFDRSHANYSNFL